MCHRDTGSSLRKLNIVGGEIDTVSEIQKKYKKDYLLKQEKRLFISFKDKNKSFF
ncbi:hypothetical protein FACS189418_1560 [Clostridia bacterium]|nr:hypothetical protein FACS189418_1560 [Clostridia bacterium]